MSKKNSKYDEYVLRFTRGKEQGNRSDTCSLNGSFDYCMIVENKDNGRKRTHYFDDPNNIPKIMGNCEMVESDTPQNVKIFNREGKLTSEWEKKR